MVRDEKIKDSCELEFAIFCIESVAARFNMNVEPYIKKSKNIKRCQIVWNSANGVINNAKIVWSDANGARNNANNARNDAKLYETTPKNLKWR